MNTPRWIKSQSRQTWLMLAAILMLLILIATRWGYTSHTAAKAFRDRFVPPDSLIK